MMNKYLQVLNSIPSNLPRDEWVKTAFASHSAGISFEEWDLWSSSGDTYNKKNCKAVWNSIKGSHGINAGTLFYIAKQYGHSQLSSDNDSFSKVKGNTLSTKNNVSETVQSKFSKYLDAPIDHPYIVRKNGWNDGLKVVPLDSTESIGGFKLGGALVVPCWQGKELKTIQYITNERKLNLPGASFGEGYFLQGVQTEKIFVTEGIGQLWAGIEATSYSAVCTFGISRTKIVVSKLKHLYPSSEIIICADGGQESYVEKLSKELKVKAVFMPSGSIKNSDINDLLLKDGREALKLLLKNPINFASIDEFKPNNSYESLKFIFANELNESYTPPDEIVEGVLTYGDGSILYGDSNSGKTFLVIDLACAIAQGVDWMGRKTECGLVIYLAAENPSSVERRIQGYQKHHNVKLANFVIVKSPIDLFNGEADSNKIISLVKHIENKTGKKALLIVGDTLARLSAGANENAGQDMGVVVQHFDKIRSETNAHFMLIHHSGKNASAGARGWSGVRAAVDTEIEVTDSTNGRCCEITKQRDLATKGERIGFKLESVHLGFNKWNTPSSVAIVVQADAPLNTKAKRLSEVGGAIYEFLRTNSGDVKKTDLVKHFLSQYDKSSVYRELKKLRDSGQVHENFGYVVAVKSVDAKGAN